jgi:hypothetical protein
MLAMALVDVLLSATDALDRWLEPAWQAAVIGSKARTRSRVSRRGMGFSGRIVGGVPPKRCGPKSFIAFFTPGTAF